MMPGATLGDPTTYMIIVGFRSERRQWRGLVVPRDGLGLFLLGLGLGHALLALLLPVPAAEEIPAVGLAPCVVEAGGDLVERLAQRKAVQTAEEGLGRLLSQRRFGAVRVVRE